MKILMCAPSHYAIQYEINPWMKMKNPINPERAMAQWEGLYNTFRKLGIQVWKVPQTEGCPDMVFTANAGVVSGKTFIPSHFRFPERRGEEPGFKKYFKKKGYAIRDAAKGLFFEGEGDLLPYRDMLFGGFRYRSEVRAHERVSESLGKRLVTLELSTPQFYHLDTCFLPLDDRTALYYPKAFDAYGRKVIQRFVENPVVVSEEDAYQFACNGLRVGSKVVLNRVSRQLKGQLRRLGYQTVESPTSEFMKAGGSVKCLTLIL